MTRSERQNLAIERWKAAGCRNCIVQPTGTGKTRTALTAIRRVLDRNPKAKVTVVVPTKVLKSQWEKQIKEWELETTVLVMNTAAKKPFHCHFLVIDEAQHISSDYLRNIFNNCNPILILGLTATYDRLDGKEKEVLDKYAPVCDEITLEEAISNNWINSYKEYKVLLDVDLTEYNKANTTFMNHFAFFNFEWNDFMNCVTNPIFRAKYAKHVNCTLKEVQAHAFACNKAMQFRKNFIFNHPKKLEVAKKILDHRKQSKAITFNGSIEQCKKYGFGYILHSKNKKKENEEIIQKYTNDKYAVLHTSKMADEGLDVKGVNIAIITGFTSSQISKRQRIGRAIRFEEGKNAEIFTLVLNNTQECKWYNKSTEGLSYIELSEQELDEVLNYKSLDNKHEKIQEKEYSFRY